MDKYIGIDVAKATLQIYIPKNDSDLEIKNSPDGLKKLYSKLKKQYGKELNDIVFVYESTGSYSTYLEQFSESKNIKCFKVGAYQSASFSKVVKNRSKTDVVDARMLSNMSIVANNEDIKIPKRDVNAHQIRSYVKYYQSLVKEEVRNFLLKLNKKEKISIFITSHYMEDIEKLVDRIILIDKGKKVWEGEVKDLISKADFKKVEVLSKTPNKVYEKAKKLDIKELNINKNKVSFFIKRDKLFEIKELIDNDLIDIKVESPSLEDLIKDLYEELKLNDVQ